MAERYDLMTARKVGDKTYWTKIGVMFANRNGPGFRLSFEALPVASLYDGKLETVVMAFEPKPRDDEPRQQRQSSRRDDGPDDDSAIPF